MRLFQQIGLGRQHSKVLFVTQARGCKMDIEEPGLVMHLWTEKKTSQGLAG